MKITVKQLKQVIREALSEPYAIKIIKPVGQWADGEILRISSGVLTDEGFETEDSDFIPRDAFELIDRNAFVRSHLERRR